MDHNYKTGNTKSTKSKEKHYCDQGRYLTEYIVTYSDEGKVIFSGYVNSNNEAVPGTVGEGIHNFICSM